MFRMLVFLIALPQIGLISWLGTVYLSKGCLAEGLPFAALALMCVSYLVKGVAETVEWIRGRIK